VRGRTRIHRFVPSKYQVALRIFPEQRPGTDRTVGERELALLPAPARDLLRLGTKVDQAAYELTTENTRALAEALNEGGLVPMPMGEPVLRYALEDSHAPGNTLYVLFAPILPHGEAVFPGPISRSVRLARGDEGPNAGGPPRVHGA
jgi:hypothetical protein